MAEQDHHLQLASRLHALGLLGGHRGEVTMLKVLHDDDCPLLERKGICNCDPEMQINGKSYLYSQVITAAETEINELTADELKFLSKAHTVAGDIMTSEQATLATREAASGRFCEGCSFCCWGLKVDRVPLVSISGNPLGQVTSKEAGKDCAFDHNNRCSLHNHGKMPFECSSYACPYALIEAGLPVFCRLQMDRIQLFPYRIHKPEVFRKVCQEINLLGYIPTIPLFINPAAAEELIRTTHFCLGSSGKGTYIALGCREPDNPALKNQDEFLPLKEAVNKPWIEALQPEIDPNNPLAIAESMAPFFLRFSVKQMNDHKEQIVKRMDRAIKKLGRKLNTEETIRELNEVMNIRELSGITIHGREVKTAGGENLNGED